MHFLAGGYDSPRTAECVMAFLFGAIIGDNYGGVGIEHFSAPFLAALFHDSPAQ